MERAGKRRRPQDDEARRRRRSALSSRRAWTKAEDLAILSLVAEFKDRWAQLAEAMVTRFRILGRTGKQCRERYHNHLDPSVHKGPWTEEEDRVMSEAHARYGNRWSKIAALLPGRTDNQIKNHWYSRTRRNMRQTKLAMFPESAQAPPAPQPQPQSTEHPPPLRKRPVRKKVKAATLAELRMYQQAAVDAAAQLVAEGAAGDSDSVKTLAAAQGAVASLANVDGLALEASRTCLPFRARLRAVLEAAKSAKAAQLSPECQIRSVSRSSSRSSGSSGSSGGSRTGRNDCNSGGGGGGGGGGEYAARPASSACGASCDSTSCSRVAGSKRRAETAACGVGDLADTPPRRRQRLGDLTNTFRSPSAPMGVEIPPSPQLFCTPRRRLSDIRSPITPGLFSMLVSQPPSLPLTPGLPSTSPDVSKFRPLASPDVTQLGASPLLSAAGSPQRYGKAIKTRLFDDL